jgi:formylglycine-generating enzyme required for sulfatase activity
MGDDAEPYSMPLHKVTIKPFQMAKTEVTNAQYTACVEAGACTPSGSIPHASNADQAIGSVTWDQAKAFSEWAGGRLPTEAEWEYAARSAGKDWAYPWGNESATCAKAIMSGCREHPYSPYSSSPCYFPQGNTEQGLCDMAGNVEEWAADFYASSYAGAPADGSAVETERARSVLHYRVTRGGHSHSPADSVRATKRGMSPQGENNTTWRGFRPAR